MFVSAAEIGPPPLSAPSGERKGPAAERWEGEVRLGDIVASVIDTHLTQPSPP
jgi:hypothetical protein